LTALIVQDTKMPSKDERGYILSEREGIDVAGIDVAGIDVAGIDVDVGTKAAAVLQGCRMTC
jgi:hypothetical protein